MPQCTLTLKTYQRTVRGKIKLCGILSVKGGGILLEEFDKSTLKELSRSLRRSGYIPTNLTIEKRDYVEFQYQGKEMPKGKKPERTVSAINFVGTIAANVNNSHLSDREFRAFIKRTLPIVIYDGC